MQGLQNLDIELFRWINLKWVNPLFDQIMPFVSGNSFFFPVLVLLGFLLITKGGARGFICVLMLVLVVSIGDGFVCKTIKEAIARPRPFLVITDTHCIVGKSGSGSMPSSHAANWFSATMVALVYYRRSLWFMLPCALLVSLSRVYNGVHYPSDIVAGAILGAGYAVAILYMVNWAWAGIGRRWFPLWWERMPNVLNPSFRVVSDEEELPPESMPLKRGMAPEGFTAPQVTMDAQWVRLGYLVIAVLLIARWLYIASGTIQLAEDEAYQWLWSKHLALSYYSKPPFIALTQFAGTHIWGDTAFGVRFFSPLIAAFLSFLLLRFLAREFNARAGFFLILMLTATVLMGVGAVLMTVDPLSVLFWTLAMISGWRAVQERSNTSDWLLVGLWMGFGFLSKYTALFQLLSWVLFMILWTPARKQLRRPGPYLALAVMAVCSLPVVIWNAQHHWITVTHVADRAGAGEVWKPTLRFVGEFLGAELGLLNPVFFLGVIWASFSFWRTSRHNPKLLYLFSMGAPVFLVYFLYSFRARILPNWIAPSVVPLFCLLVAYADQRWRLAAGQGRSVGFFKFALTFGLVVGFAMVVMGHQTDIARKFIGHYLPVKYDPLHRVREWKATADAVNTARLQLTAENKPVFIITDHYGLAGQISFYVPEAKEAVNGTPLVYYKTSLVPNNQFFFWPGYRERKGDNAIYVRELDRSDPKPPPLPGEIAEEFESVTSLGVTNVMYHGYLLRPLQLFACRGVK